MSPQKDPWLLLQREITAALDLYDGHQRCKILVYILLRASIDVVVEDTGTFVHLRRIIDSDKSTILITSNKSADLVVHASPDGGFILDSGEILAAHEFCVWVLDLACKLSDAVSS